MPSAELHSYWIRLKKNFPCEAEMIGRDYRPTKENLYRLIEPLLLEWRYPSLFSENHLIFNLTTVN